MVIPLNYLSFVRHKTFCKFSGFLSAHASNLNHKPSSYTFTLEKAEFYCTYVLHTVANGYTVNTFIFYANPYSGSLSAYANGELEH